MKDNIILPTTALAPKGKVSLELFDAQGNVVDRVEKTNFVQQKLLEAVGKAYMSSGIGNTGLEGPTRNYYRGMVLTDNDKEPNPAVDKFIEGNIIAHGATNALGAESFRGNYNAEESTFDTYNGYIKQVYDFSTNQANGTFQSVYMASNGIPTASNATVFFEYPVEHPNLLVQQSTGSNSTTYYHSPKYMYYIKGMVHYLSGSNLEIYAKIPMKNISSRWLFLENVPHEKYTLPFSCVGMTYIATEDRYYFLTGASSNSNLYSAPASNPIDFRLERNLNAISGMMTASLTGIVYHRKTNSFLVSSTGNTFLQRISKNYTFLERVELPTGLGRPQELRGSGFDNDVVYFSQWGQSKSAYGINLETMVPLQYFGSIYSSYNGMDYAEISEDWAVCHYRYSTSNSYFEIVPTYKFFSRALLDSPVTKTSQNTMKITYEYTFEPVTF